VQREERRDDPGRRGEGAGADIEQRLHPHPGGEHHREPAVVLVAGTRGHARHDFLLQHEVHVGDGVELRDEAEQQRRRDVVGQVADEAQPCACAAQRAEVELERVGEVHAQVAEPPATLLQPRHHVGIDLDDVDRAGGCQQRSRDCTAARADLHEAVAGRRRDGAHDPLDRARIVQEMLAVALLRVFQGRRVAQSPAASASAARRLPASARPVPARSSAVP